MSKHRLRERRKRVQETIDDLVKWSILLHISDEKYTEDEKEELIVLERNWWYTRLYQAGLSDLLVGANFHHVSKEDPKLGSTELKSLIAKRLGYSEDVLANKLNLMQKRKEEASKKTLTDLRSRIKRKQPSNGGTNGD